MTNDTAYNANAFALTFAFAPSHTGNASKVKRECKPSHTTVQTYVQTLTDTALNVNRFGQPDCKLESANLRIDRRATDNKVLPKARVTGFYDTFVLNRTLVFQINSSAEIPAFGNTQTVTGKRKATHQNITNCKSRWQDPLIQI